MEDRSFTADFGTFDSENKSIEKVESLKKEILACYPFLKFADTKGSFSESLSYFVPEYGYSQSADGMSVSFVHADRPYNVAGILYVEKIMDGYNMNLSLKAEPKPVM